MNAHRERIIAIELCDHVVILNQSHADRVLGAYQRHHNGPRPPRAAISHHRVRTSSPSPPDVDPRRLRRTHVLGGLINEYRYAA